MDARTEQALLQLDPAGLSYSDWVRVGMALKREGCPCSVWTEWSARDPARFHPGECESKWAGFDDCARPVTAATIVSLAKDQGYVPSRPRTENRALDWNDEIGPSQTPCQPSSAEPPAQDPGTASCSVEGAQQSAPADANDPLWDEPVLPAPELADLTPAQQLKLWIQALFRPEEVVGYVTGDTFQDTDGKWKPRRGVVHRTAGELVQSLNRHPDDLSATVGDTQPEAGAWIRFNPLDGQGARNENVTRFSCALVESDSMPPVRQAELLKALRLPIVCLTFSGGKSLHALVRVDAENPNEYRARVQLLYDRLRQAGLDVDGQNCNPARLTRMPGALRNGVPQRLIAVNTGCSDWRDWNEWWESRDDGLPPWVPLSAVQSNPPSPPAELIGGVLRCGHKMLLSGSSKAGKSFLLMELCVAIAEGREWLGFPCRRGRVLYVNLEIDPQSCLLRFLKIYEALGIPPAHVDEIVVWNLRGRALPMDALTPKLIRRAQGGGFSAIVLDPIYKVITGDENNASDMGAFCNQFDKICEATGAACIYCHHHSKGAQGLKRAMDRASGSGVFARDPDAQLDMIRLELSDDLKNNVRDGNATAWRMEGTLREFPAFAPVNFWYRYPLHIVDGKNLNSMPAEGSLEAGRMKNRRVTTKEERRIALETAYEYLAVDETGVSVKDMADYMGVTDKAARDRVRESGDIFRIENGKVIRSDDDVEDGEEPAGESFELP